MLPVVFVGVALALIAAIVFSSDRSINAETGVPEVTGEALAPHPGNMLPADDPAVGIAAPAVVGEDFDGNTVSIDPTDGSPKAIMFLAHWCPHCQAEVPRVQA
ncbi:MAG: redoxin domain-containing protein, partial [Actinomycetota bacterium]|nr:redoxin domain-containing protein [Actinomycetota bacterium]